MKGTCQKGASCRFSHDAAVTKQDWQQQREKGAGKGKGGGGGSPPYQQQTGEYGSVDVSVDLNAIPRVVVAKKSS